MPGDRTLLVLFPGCILFETALATELLHPHLPVEVATPDGEAHASSSGLTIAADHALADVDPARYRAVLIPGGDVESVLENDALSELLRRALDGGAVVGAICAGPLLVARAGLLAGRRFIHGFKDWHTDFLAPSWEGAELGDGRGPRRLRDRAFGRARSGRRGHPRAPPPLLQGRIWRPRLIDHWIAPDTARI